MMDRTGFSPTDFSRSEPVSDEKRTPNKAPSCFVDRDKVRFIDLFSGAGGFTLAAQKLGCRAVAAVDSYPHAVATYRRNFVMGKQNPPKVFEADIEHLSPAVLMSDCHIEAGDCQLVLGGPPCQGFSTHRFKDAGVDDPRNRLLTRYFDYVEKIRPTAFIVENVPGLLWKRHEAYLLKFFALAEEAGYEVEPPVVINARDFGVPQNRKRVFILGRERGRNLSIEWPPKPTHHCPESSGVLEMGKPSWTTASDVFNTPLRSDDPNNVHMKSGPELTAVFERTPKNGGSRNESGRVLRCHLDHSGHKDVYGRIDPGKPGPTMTTACINPSKGRFVHPEEPHGITVRHAARFQTFPDDFVFGGGLMAGGIQVGNAVPVRLGEAVLRPIIEALRNISE